MHRAIFAAALIAGGLAAQGTGPFKNGDYLILCGFADSGGPLGSGNSYPVSRFKDLDGDGRIDDGTELFAFLKVSFNTRNSTGSFMSDMDWVQEGDTYAFYIADSGDGRITRGVDVDNDGLLQAGEVTEFFDFQSAYSPDGIAVYRAPGSNQTIVYVAQDDSGSPYGRGIHRLVDLNGDGDAFDPGEQAPFVDAAANLTVPGRTGPVALVSHYWEQVHVLGDGTVVAFSRGSSNPNTPNNPDQFCWYAFTDNNGTASASVFFNPSRVNDIPTHPDFDTGGAFPQWEVTVSDPATGVSKTYNDVQFFAQQAPTGSGVRDAYFTATYNTGGNFVNPQGVNVHGLFYRWRDANGNFRIDTNEITLFANFSNAAVAGVNPFILNTPSGGAFNEQGGPIFTLKATDGQVHLVYGLGGTGAPNKGIMLLEDGDANGTISTSEATLSYQFSGATTTVYSPQYGPFIKDASAFDRGLMPGPFQTGLVPYGQGCPDPNTGLSPVCDAYGGPPSVGNTSFGLAASRLPAGASTYLFVGFGRASLPIPPPLGRPGCNLLLNAVVGLGPIVSANDGVSAQALPVPNDPSLVNGTLNVQWANLVVQGTGGTLVMSNGLEITIQP